MANVGQELALEAIGGLGAQTQPFLLFGAQAIRDVAQHHSDRPRVSTRSFHKADVPFENPGRAILQPKPGAIIVDLSVLFELGSHSLMGCWFGEDLARLLKLEQLSRMAVA